MAGLSDADQGGLPAPRLDSGGADRARPGVVHGSGTTQRGVEGTRDPGVAELLLQVADDGAGTVSGARFIHSVDETEEHAASLERRRVDHAPWVGVLRLKSGTKADPSLREG